MKIIFVDAENVGFKGLDAINASIADKVFVFSRVESIKVLCEKKLYLCLSDYPEGANQADFYIIAYLLRVLSCFAKEQKSAIEFVLYTNDLNLIAAFEFQCGLLGAKSKIHSFKQEASVVCNITELTKTNQLEKQIYKMLKEPRGLLDIQTTLKLSKPVFTRAVNGLIKTEKIKRASNNGKNWVQIKNG